MKRFNLLSQEVLPVAGTRWAARESADTPSTKSMQSTTRRENSTTNLSKLCSLVVLLAVIFALFPAHLQAAPKHWVYLNDNNNGGATHGTNTVYGFENDSPGLNKLLAIGGEPALGWATHGNSVVHTEALKDQALLAFSSTACLFVGEPLASPSMPNGDIAAFFVDTNTGHLSLTARYPTPAGISTYWGIALTTRKSPATLYAGYSIAGGGTVGVWKILNTKCELKLENKVVVSALHGGAIFGMAEAPNGDTLALSYGDGSIESFQTPLWAVTAAPCTTAIDSLGFTDGNNGYPDQVDITKDSAFAIFGDQPGLTPPYGPTELEMIPLPITCTSGIGTPGTTDFGGPIVANTSYLGSNLDSTDIWISPDENFIYVTNEDPTRQPGFTSVAFSEIAYPGAATMSLAAGCTAGFANPISLKTLSGHSGFWEAQGIQTHATTGHGTRVYIGEEWKVEPPSAVGLLDLDIAGCVQEAPLSPFANPGPSTGGGAGQVSAWPPRPF